MQDWVPCKHGGRLRWPIGGILPSQIVVPAGLIIGTRMEGGGLRLELDFAIPKYRDFKIARHLFHDERPFFKEHGIGWVEAIGGNQTHNDYLARMGFKPVDGQDNLYRLALEPDL